MKNNMEPFITVQKVFWQQLCKLEDHCFKTKEIDRKNVQKSVLLQLKKRICPPFLILWNKADTKEQFIMVYKDFQQLFCKL